MTASEAISRLAELLDRYDQMQRAHTRELRENALEGLDRLCFEREKAFANIKNEIPWILKAIRSAGPGTRSATEKLQRQYQEIQRRETALAAHLIQRRDDTQTILLKKARSKTALKAYGSR